MNTVGGTSPLWAVVMIVLVPLAIIAAAEFDERLRQRDSALRSAVVMLRSWTLPFFAIWALLVPVLGVDRDSFAVRVAATGLLLSVAAAGLRALRVGVVQARTRAVSQGRNAPELLLMLPRLLVVLVIGWLLIDTVWGVDLSAALTALGVTSLVVSFALQDTLSGLASGVLLLSDQPIQPGHWIQIGGADGTEGRVVDINWRTTRIRTRNGDMVIVPNSELAQGSIVNYSDVDSLHRLVVPIQVAFVNPPTLAKEMLIDAALGTEGVLASPPPEAIVTAISDPLVDYAVHLWVDDYAVVPRVTSDFASLVWYQSQRHDVPLPNPAQDLFIYDGPSSGDAAAPGPAEIRNALTGSPLLASVDDADLDRLAQATTFARYATGELISDSSSASHDLVVIVEGHARVVLRKHDGSDVTFGELSDGDIAGLPGEQPLKDHDIGVRAVTDCQVATVATDTIEEVASRSVDLAAALNRTSSLRRRRAERLLSTPVDPIDDIDAGSDAP